MLLAVTVLLVAATGCGSASPDHAVGYTAADMATGKTISIDTLRGRPAVLVSWATWCRECDAELTALQAFATSPNAKNLQIVAVNLDAADVQAEIDAKIERHGLSVELWRDRRNQFKRTFGALGVPTAVVLDARGVVVGTFPGATPFDNGELLAAIRTARDSS